MSDGSPVECEISVRTPRGWKPLTPWRKRLIRWKLLRPVPPSYMAIGDAGSGGVMAVSTDDGVTWEVPSREPVMRPGYKRPMYADLDTPTTEELQRMLDTGDPLDAAIVELWRGRSIVSSVTAARLSREHADALLVALGEIPADG